MRRSTLAPHAAARSRRERDQRHLRLLAGGIASTPGERASWVAPCSACCEEALARRVATVARALLERSERGLRRGEPVREKSDRLRRCVHRTVPSLRHRPLSFLVSAIALGACRPTGCSSTDAPRGSASAKNVEDASRRTPIASPAPVTEAVALCKALHAEPARRRAECCGGSSPPLPYDECVRHLSNSLRAGSVRVDPGAIVRCASAVRKQVAGCDWVAPTLAAPPEECRGIVVGLVPSGESCRSSLECEGALHCEGQGSSSPGVCRPPQPIGATCGVGVDPLATYVAERGLERSKPSCADHCSLVTHRCEARPEPGAACRASVNCAPDQRCREGRCRPRPVMEKTAGALPGEVCRSDLDCAVGGCTVSEDGRARCGMKCSSALGSLTTTSASKALPLATPK